MAKTKRSVLVLDADNTLFLDSETGRGSEEIKDAAWYLVFPEHGREELDRAMKAARGNLASFAAGQADRQDLVREVCKYFGIPEGQIANEVVSRCDAFNQIVQKGIAEIGVSSETRAALARLSQAMPIYVNTATPREAAVESLDALGLTPLLKGVRGRPGTKLENLKSIIEVEGVAPSQVLLVDDQPTGWSAAQQVGCNFIGMYTVRNTAWHNAPQPFPIIRSLSELPSLV